MESRSHFVKQVSETLRNSHGKSRGESFIFGISGKWGEGKTRFLNDLESELKEEFEIVKINPWKYAGDKTSFLRNFLCAVSKKLSGTSRAWMFIKNMVRGRNDFQELFFDVSKNTINWFYLIVISLILAGLLSFYKLYLVKEYPAFIGNWKIPFTIIAIPAVLAIFGRIVTVKKGSRSISTVDKFDDVLKNVLCSLKSKKILVFVDDLDRVTPQSAREVLDNLRTFFDKEELSFVVAGDHTVLERYLGKELLPNSDNEPEQLEEGRRFLKKIFNVYWRLPLPLDQEFKKALLGIIEERSEAIAVFFDEKQREQFFHILENHFEKNFRQVIRFIENVIFTFQAIKTQYEEADEENKKYLSDLLDKPLLVVRILIIQDFCNPLFEEILKEYKILADLEYAVEKKSSPEIDQILERFKDKLSDSQKNFVKRFIYVEPRFYKNNSLDVYAIEPFLYFAADVSLGDKRGPSAEDFVSTLAAGISADVKNALMASGSEKLKTAIDETIKLLQSNVEKKIDNLTTLLKTAIEIPENHPSQEMFVNSLVAVDIAFDGSPEARMSIYKLFWQWLDYVKSEGIVEKYQNKFVFNNENINYLQIEKGGRITTPIVVSWLVAYYGQDPLNALRKMQEIYPNLVIEQVQEGMANIAESLAQNLIDDENEDSRNLRYEILTKFTQHGNEILRKKIFDNVATNENLWTWSLNKVSAEQVLWIREELEQKQLESIKSATDSETLYSRLRYSNGKVLVLLGNLWDYLLGAGYDSFLEIFQRIVDEPSFEHLAPESAKANTLFARIVEIVKDSDDVNGKRGWLKRLRKEKWVWRNLSQMPVKSRLTGMMNTKDDNLKAVVSSVIESWKQVGE